MVVKRMLDSITIFVVDGDKSIRNAMARLMTANGYRAVCVASIDDLLQRDLPSSKAALLVDTRTARQFAGSLQEQLQARGTAMPVIYLTDCDTETGRREAKRVGAAGYFRKPVDEHALFDAISFAVQNESAHSTAERTEERPVFS